MKSSLLLTAVVVAAATLTTSATAMTSSRNATAAAVHSLRHAIQWHRVKTWQFQDRAGVARTRSVYAERRTWSVAFLRWDARLWLQRQTTAARLATRAVPTGGGVQSVICGVFGAACSQALAVARCESGFSIHAINGQYLGLFQMGSSERATYATAGYATAYEQTVAAHNYFAVAGWGPWSCRP